MPTDSPPSSWEYDGYDDASDGITGGTAVAEAADATGESDSTDQHSIDAGEDKVHSVATSPIYVLPMTKSKMRRSVDATDVHENGGVKEDDDDDSDEEEEEFFDTVFPENAISAEQSDLPKDYNNNKSTIRRGVIITTATISTTAKNNRDCNTDMGTRIPMPDGSPLPDDCARDLDGYLDDGNGEESAVRYPGTVNTSLIERRTMYKNLYDCYAASMANSADAPPSSAEPASTKVRRLSRQLSRQLSRSGSLVSEQLPDTTRGWMILTSAVVGTMLAYELQLQRKLTCPPLVYAHHREGVMKSIYERMTQTPHSILRRNIRPSLFVGTRAQLSSAAGYLFGGPAANRRYLRFREIMKMTVDGATIAVEWELPTNKENAQSREELVNHILQGPIRTPVVVILHGLNNHANFGYILSMMRACCDRGWIAAGFNMRGCGGVPLSTPRGYNAAYTGDIRCFVQKLSARLAPGIPIFLVGHSLSASLVTKYLGEEGRSGTLPLCVAGGAALGIPSHMNATTIRPWVFSPLLALGTKRILLENWATLHQMNDAHTKACIRRALGAVTLADFDQAMASIKVRNDSQHPFAFRIGFRDGRRHTLVPYILPERLCLWDRYDGEEYWHEASAYRLVRFVSVPLLQLVASDDFLVYHSFKGKLAYSLSNPNVMIVESKCGGHLGWHEAPPDANSFGVGTSWAIVATTDFITAVFESYSKTQTSQFSLATATTAARVGSSSCKSTSAYLKPMDRPKPLHSTIPSQSRL